MMFMKPWKKVALLQKPGGGMSLVCSAQGE